MASIQFFAWILLILLLSTLLNVLWRWSLPHRWLLVFLWPGVVLHEMSHAAACLVTGAKIHEIKFFKAGGGYVLHEPSRIPVVGRVLISLAPLAGCTLALWALHGFLDSPIRMGLDFDVPSKLGWPALVELAEGIFGALEAAWRALARADYGDPITWAFLYGLLSIAVSLSPSRADLTHASIALCILFGSILVLEVFGFAALDTKWGAKAMKGVLDVLSLCGSILVTAIAATLPIAAVAKLLRK